MNNSQKQIIHALFEGKYLMKRKNHTDKDGYMLYEGNQNPIRFFFDRTVRPLREYLKSDRKKRLSLNLSAVRKLHGKNYLKKYYKERLVKDKTVSE